METVQNSVDDVPIPRHHVSAVATRQQVNEAELAEVLAAIHTDLMDGADAILHHYESEGGPPSIVVANGLAEVIFVTPTTWPRIPTEHADAVRTAAKAVHAEFARELGASDETLDAYDALVMPSTEVGQLFRAGLSRRQAEVQVLRNAGLSQPDIAAELGMATNTVKVHCHRIDTKVANANRLLELTET